MGISDAEWDNYKAIINDAHSFFNQENITWLRYSSGLPRFGEDGGSQGTTTPIVLKCLINYNIYRSWPLSEETTSGQLDKESIAAIFNRSYLASLGYINANGNFIVDPGKDYFIHRGVKYRCAGETLAAQAKDDPLLVYIILRRLNPLTGSNTY